MSFPDIQNTDFSKKGKDNQDVKDVLNYAVQQWYSRDSKRKRLDKLYNSYNGIIDKKEIDSIIKTTGIKSKTKYVKYRLGRSKIKQLHGEFLEIPINAQVTSTNRDAQNEKMQKYKNMYGMALAKPYIEKARAMGYNVFDGIQIPDKNDKAYWNVNNFVLGNEIAMGTIIKDKLTNERLKSRFYHNFIDLTIAAEVFGKNERNIDGIDTYRHIPPKYSLYEESISDHFLDKSPYLGEVRFMYYHEILTSPDLNLDKGQKEQLKQVKDQISVDPSQDSGVEMINGFPTFPVYTLQWKGLETVYKKTSPAKGSSVPYKRILSQKYFDDNKIKIRNDVKNEKYKVERFYRETVWTASRVNTNIFTPAKKNEDVIQILNENGKFSADFDYTGMLFSTVNGSRVSIQEIVFELEKIYDDIRFMINKELRKIRGDTLVYDDAYLPKDKRFIDILHSISEDGVIRYNSSAEGNRSAMETESNKVGIGAVNLGQSQILIVLLNQAMDIERVMDRITGMNESRIGLEKASSTATANMSNVEASRSMTYDMFYFMKEYIERVLVKLAEKTKLNITKYGEDSRQFVFSDEEIQYLISTKNLMFHNYAVTITDGRKEQQVLNKLEQLFPQEINAGLLRTKDVAKFYMETNFAKAIKVLDLAHNELAVIREKEMKTQQESKQAEIQSKERIATEDREDNQVQEKEMEVLRTEGKKEIEQLKGSMKATQDFQKDLGKIGLQREKAKMTNPFE